MTKWIQEAEHIYIPFVVLGELRAGFLSGNRTNKKERSLKKFLNDPRVIILYPDKQTIHYYSQIRKDLKKHGTLISENDEWIAASAISRKIPLCTMNKDFENVGSLNIKKIDV
ncbi:virulence associated protein C [Leptospira interrogans serovar Hardjo-prajitno]|nr:PIN domain-containing protein [Leptospira interrogans]ALE40535.1 virulence associated protein C [Leptospira interrogans serovar Hardjo str. Norma]ALO01365.1 virulence associated protein C [Leptospira interrogans serovar Hardjo-prajitno]EKR15329.1 PIN domain protein [Leptospira interrogans serovar Pyrogenes str. 2006006960]EMN30580.1 PIN domain protein [Leptospira interrogans serovar Pyrogenes str. L0374]EMP05032.1 PIN domain protein [Leptospira interrogans serovar Pyrogenes str. 200701872]